jgi:lysophospholipase L1-like esterase
MAHRHRIAVLCLVVLIVPQLGRTGAAQSAQSTPAAQDHWVATWGSAQQTGRGGARPGAPGAAPAAPAAAAPPVFSGFTDQTVRMAFRVSLGGARLRVHLANTFGTTPLVIGAAHVALRAQGPDIVPDSDRALRFDGKATVTIPPGAEMISDPVDLLVPPLAELAVSVFVPGPTGPLTGHSMALQTTYVSRDGDVTQDATLAEPTTTQAWYWVSEVDVAAPADAAAVVAFGDSITDGATSTPGTNGSWPSRLAERLAADPSTARVAVVNEGISGNRILADGAGVSALARFDRDVLSVAGVRWVMLLEGINDIGQLGRGGTLDPDALIGAMKQVIVRAHTHGIKVIGCTLTPYGGAGYATDAGEDFRSRVNAFIRTSPLFDAVVDFDAATRDPANPTQFLPAYNKTDHLHPNDEGYRAMANAVDLTIFTR